jgi:UDP-glucose 4-epimerase
MERILVTGGAGYVGSTTAAHLLEAGYDVTILDDLSQGDKDAIPKGTEFIRGDLRDTAVLIAGKVRFDAVVHCAGLIAAGESVKEPDKYWDVNVVSSFALLNAMRDHGIPKLIFSSSAATYGNPDMVPIKEDAPTNPTSPYGMTKLVLDMAIASYCEAYGLSATSLRYFNVAGAHGKYGERHKVETHIIPLALAAAASNGRFKLFGNDYPTPDGTCVRDYIHVADLARAHVLALKKLEGKDGTHHIYNLGNGKGFSNLEVVEAIRRVTGKRVDIDMLERRPGDPAELVASNQRAQDELGWVPERSDLDNIVRTAWEFFQNQKTS